MRDPTCQSKKANYKLEKLFVIRVKILNIKSSQEVNLSEAQKLANTESTHSASQNQKAQIKTWTLFLPSDQ